MRVCVFASGSGGNCLLMQNEGTNILLDAGISMSRIGEGLQDSGLAIRDISGVFITHEHSDHIYGMKMLLKYYALPVFAPHTVANRLRGMLPDIDNMLHIVEPGEYFTLGNVRVLPFLTPHDTDMCVGYRIEGDAVFALATDMGHVTEEMFSALKGADTVLIESNHDENMLRDGRYPVYLKRRILSDRGHLSNECCAQLARELALSGTKQIILGHLSRENNTPHLALEAAKSALEELDVQVCCAPAQGRLEVEVGKKKCSV